MVKLSMMFASENPLVFSNAGTYNDLIPSGGFAGLNP
jgi:hypothetical protein